MFNVVVLEGGGGGGGGGEGGAGAGGGRATCACNYTHTTSHTVMSLLWWSSSNSQSGRECHQSIDVITLLLINTDINFGIDTWIHTATLLGFKVSHTNSGIALTAYTQSSLFLRVFESSPKWTINLAPLKNQFFFLSCFLQPQRAGRSWNCTGRHFQGQASFGFTAGH